MTGDWVDDFPFDDAVARTGGLPEVKPINGHARRISMWRTYPDSRPVIALDVDGVLEPWRKPEYGRWLNVLDAPMSGLPRIKWSDCARRPDGTL